MALFLVGLLVGFSLGMLIMGMAWWAKREEVRELEALLGTPIKNLVEARRRR